MAYERRAPFRQIARPSSRALVAVFGAGLALAAVCAGCLSSRTTMSDDDWSRLVPGRIVVIAAKDDPEQPRNIAQAYLAGTTQVVPLWEADSEISDWLPSPDGRQVVYREVWHYVPKTEALVVRALEPNAPARYVVMGEPELSRLAGQVWSPSGDELAYGKQAGRVESFSGAGGTRRWEMRAVTVGASTDARDTDPASAGPAIADPAAADPATAGAAASDAPPDVEAALADRRLFALDGAGLGTNVYTLVAWWPEQARAVVLETPGGGGGSPALRVYDTADGRLVARVAPGGDDARAVGAPDGRRVAWLSAAAGVGTLDTATGEWRAIEAIEADRTPFGLAWSADGRWLGWAVASSEPAHGTDRSYGLTDSRSVTVFAKRLAGWPRWSGVRQARFNLDAFDGALGLLALSPAGEVALLTDVANDGRTVARTAGWTRAAPTGDMAPSMSEHRLPPGTWGVGWWP